MEGIKLSWENIVKKGGRPQINQKGSMVNVDGFETKVKISKWNYKGKERTGDCTVTWGIQIIVRDDYIREMHLSVDKIAFEDGRVYGTEGIFDCLLYTSPSPRDATLSRMPSSA